MSTFPDMVRQFGGAPVGSRYGWHSGSTTLFVDGSSTTPGDGTRLDRPYTTIYGAINAANAWDVIYVVPKTWTSGNLWLGTSYQDTTDLSISYAKTGLALVGVGHQGMVGPGYGVVITEVSASTSPLLTTNAPMCAFENLAFYRASTALSGLYINGNVAATSEAALTSVYNCHFHGVVPSGATGDTGGAVYSDGAWGTTVDKCTFLGCRIGVSIKSNAATSGNMIVRNCDFMSRLTSASDISADIYIYTQGSASLVIDNINCAHLIPSYSGGHSRWISVQADVRQGIVSRVRCAGVQAQAYTSGSAGTGITCPDNIGVCDCYSGQNLLMVEAT